MAANVSIRSFQKEDIEQITQIYNYYVKNSTATFDWDELGFDDMQGRVDKILQKNLPFLVLEQNNMILGYAYAAPFRERKGWSWAVEDSIYLHHNHGGKGYGQKLLGALIEICSQQDIRVMIAVISAKKNTASLKLHQKMGFDKVGIFSDIGYKQGEWQDIVIMQKKIGEGANTPPLNV